MKLQYDYIGLIRFYLGQNYPHASTAEDRMSYQGTILKSYDSILAQLYSDYNILIINEYTRHYSTTTSRHTNKLIATTNREHPHKRILHIWKHDEVKDTVNDHIIRINCLIKAYKKAKTKHLHYKNSILQLYQDIETYILIHPIDKRLKEYKAFNSLFRALLQEKIL